MYFGKELGLSGDEYSEHLRWSVLRGFSHQLFLQSSLSQIFARDTNTQIVRLVSNVRFFPYVCSFQICNFNLTAVTFDLKEVNNSLENCPVSPFGRGPTALVLSFFIIMSNLDTFFFHNIAESNKSCFFLGILIFHYSWYPARKSWHGTHFPEQ